VVTGLANAAQLTASDLHTCARLTDGALRCWGYNGNGQLGDGTTANRTTPVAVSGIANATQVSTFYRTTCAALADQTVRCWGDNGNGQVGDGTAVDRNVPVPVAGLRNLPACDVTPGAPSVETCNNIDDDCNGVVDESLSRTCYNGPAGTAGVGACRAGAQTCGAGAWSACAGEVLPRTEVCNGVDDNCNGIRDEGLTCP
jgi:hypothetical protein